MKHIRKHDDDLKFVIKNVKATARGWVDLSNLVYSGNFIRWSESIGKTVDFRYDDIISTLTIRDIDEDDKQYVYIDVPEYAENFRIYVGQIKHGQLGSVIKKVTSDFKYKVGEVVNNMLITEKYRKGTYKYYNFCCTKDSYIGHIREDHLGRNHGCPVCAGKQVLKGYNDIATTRPDLINLFYDKNDAFLYMEHSNKYVDFKCPRCGNKIRTMISCVSYNGLSCKKCGDGISYPNKFVYNFIEQVSNLHSIKGKLMSFDPEKKFEWSMSYCNDNKKLSGKKIYDMYIYEYNIIIESHGDYHYTNRFESISDARSFEEVQENDKIKMDLAISNGIKKDHYIVLDCRKSEMLYIKNSIMSSNLPRLLNFTENDIDWIQCNKFATSSRVYEACCHWNNGIKSCKKIASIMKMDRNTINRYIKRGMELGIVIN